MRDAAGWPLPQSICGHTPRVFNVSGILQLIMPSPKEGYPTLRARELQRAGMFLKLPMTCDSSAFSADTKNNIHTGSCIAACAWHQSPKCAQDADRWRQYPWLFPSRKSSTRGKTLVILVSTWTRLPLCGISGVFDEAPCVFHAHAHPCRLCPRCLIVISDC